jgi:hypothetical protein
LLVVIAGVIAVALLVEGLASGRDVAVALAEAYGGALLTMLVGGTALRFWSGGQLSTADVGPKGIRVGFAVAETAVEALNERVSGQMAEINRRLDALELRVREGRD